MDINEKKKNKKKQKKQEDQHQITLISLLAEINFFPREKQCSRVNPSS